MIKEILNIAVCQCGVEWKDPEGNRNRLEAFVRGYLEKCGGEGRPDMVTLPEFFTTGFTADASRLKILQVLHWAGCRRWQRRPASRSQGRFR